MSAVEGVSNNFFQIAKEKLAKTDEKISSYIFAAKIFIMIAFFFNPWTLSIFLSKAYIVTIWAIASSIAALGLVATTYFYAKDVFVSNDINLQISRKREEDLYGVKNFRPIGLENTTGANCWANAVLQFVMNVPRYRESLRNCSHRVGDVSLASLFDQYEQDKNNFCQVSSVNTQYLRQIVHMENGHFNQQGANSEDAFEPFDILSDWLPKTAVRYSTVCSHMISGKPLENQNGFALEFLDNERFCSSRIVNEKNFSLEIPSCDGPLDLNSLLDHHFERENYGGDVGVNFLDPTSQIRSYPLLSREMKILSAPKDLCLHLKRFKTENNAPSKNIKDVMITPRLTLKNKKHLLGPDAEYSLDSFIVHYGNFYGGHYMAFVLKFGRWFACNDRYVNEISEENALSAANQAYIVHYSKL